MKLVRHTVRLAPPLDKALRALADRQGVSVYAMLQRSVTTGVASLANPSGRSDDSREFIAELASVGTRMIDVEHMLDRALFTACAAYCYARSAALGEREDEETITAEIHAAYERQRHLARERQT
jgi:hypothetical protein